MTRIHHRTGAPYDVSGHFVLRCAAGGELVDHVTQGSHILGHAVVDVTGEPLTLLGCGDRANVVEEQSGVQSDSVTFQDLLDRSLRRVG
ncbi:MAG: hypothetical protein V9F00_02620 [Nocardioides sp.]